MRYARVGALAAAMTIVAPLPASARAPIPAAASWIAARQASDGGFFGEQQPADATAEAVAALRVSGKQTAVVARALDYIRRAGPARASVRPAYAGRIVMGLVAAGQNPRDFGGVDYVSRITEAYRAGTYETGVYAHALAILGLVAAREPVPGDAITYLRANQCGDGGYGHEPGCVPRGDTDTTAMVICALAGAGVPAGDLIRSRAREWLRSVRVAGGGYPHRSGDQVNANSTGLAVSALACGGQQDAQSVSVLRSMQTGDGGVRYRASDAQANSYATVQAIPALAGSGYPVRVAREASKSGASLGSSPGVSRHPSSGAPSAAGGASPPSSRSTSQSAAVASPAGTGSPLDAMSDRSDIAASDPGPSDGAPGGNPVLWTAGIGFAAIAAAAAGARVPARIRRGKQ